MKFLYLILAAIVSMAGLLPAVSLAQDVTFTQRPWNDRLYPVEKEGVDESTYSASIDRGARTAIVKIEGVAKTSIYQKLQIEIQKNKEAMTTKDIRFSQTSAPQNFQFQHVIDAELSSYRFAVFGVKSNGTRQSLLTADSVVAGRVLVFLGQSNAVSSTYENGGDASAYHSPFVKTIDGWRTAERGVWLVNPSRPIPPELSQLNWKPATWDSVGNWPLVTASKLSSIYQMPIAVINGAVGGKKVEYFQKTYVPIPKPNGDIEFENAYKRLMRRLNEHSLTSKVSAFFWWQGETDSSAGTTTQRYIELFSQLHSDLKQDLAGFGWKTYLTQVRGCMHKNAQGENDQVFFDLRVPKIQEAQRQIYLSGEATSGYKDDKFRILSANGLQQRQDLCHYDFPGGGYEKIGTQWVPAVARDLFGYPPTQEWGKASSFNLLPYRAVKMSDTEIRLYITGAQYGVTVDAYTELLNRFRLEPKPVAPTANAIPAAALAMPMATLVSSSREGSTSTNQLGKFYLTIQFSGSISVARGLTYLSHAGGPSPNVWNLNAKGERYQPMINFLDMPIANN